jgi:hypothetical protein
MSLLLKLEQDFQSLKVHLAGASARVDGYVTTGIKLGTELEKVVNSGIGQIVLSEVFAKIGVTDPAMQEDILNAIPKALAYATQSQEVLTAATPEEQLNLFLADIASDAPGTKVAKIDLVIEKVIANLDGNSLVASLYKWLLSHAKTTIAVAPAPVIPEVVVEAPVETMV